MYSHRASAKVQDVVGQRRQMQRGQGLPEAAPGFFCHIGRASSSDCGPSIYMLDIYIHIYIYIYSGLRVFPSNILPMSLVGLL